MKEATLPAVLFSFVLVAAVAYSRRRSQTRVPLPPGPPKLPLIGNLLSMPKAQSPMVFHEWAKKFGSDVLQVDVAGQSIVILDSYEAAVDLLDKRSAIYSSRPYTTMLCDPDLIGINEWDFVSMPYGELWRSHRRLFHQTLHEGAAKVFRPGQVKHAHKLLTQLLTTPENFRHHIKHFTASTIMYIAYGFYIQDDNDPFLEKIEYVMDHVLEAYIPGRYLVDAVPLLKYIPDWFPGTGFKEEARLLREAVNDAREKPFQLTKRMIEEGRAEPSFISLALASASTLADEKEKSDLELKAAQIATVMSLAGEDTTGAVLTSAFYALLLNPHVQQKAHEELHRVVALDHLPTFDDQDSLPYISAILLETLRWNPALPIGVPHLVEEDDTYHGYFVPKQSMVVGNAWGMLHNEDIFPNPEVFDPERFLKDGKINPDVLDPVKVVFGFGRRICPGRHLAISSAWIAIASVLAAFDILPDPATGDNHNKAAFDEVSLIRWPFPFKCSIKPRSNKAAELIHASSLTLP